MSDTEGLGQYFQVANWMYVRPLVDADSNKLSPNEQKALADSIAQYSSLSYDEIKEATTYTASKWIMRDGIL